MELARILVVCHSLLLLLLESSLSDQPELVVQTGHSVPVLS
jgi:hypothetical protein